MEIRRYESRDLEQIACLFYETVHTSHLNHIESQIKSEYLSVPSKAILLEEGKVAEKLYLIRKGCLWLFFYNLVAHVFLPVPYMGAT